MSRAAARNFPPWRACSRRRSDGRCGAPPTCARPPRSVSPSAPMRSSGYVLRDRFARYFGVWREADHGRAVDVRSALPARSGVAAARRAAAARGALLPAGPQYRPLPLCGGGAHRRGRPAARATSLFGTTSSFPSTRLCAARATCRWSTCSRRGEGAGLRSGRGILLRCQRHREGDDLESLGRLSPRVHAGPLVELGAAGRRSECGQTQLETSYTAQRYLMRVI